MVSKYPQVTAQDIERNLPTNNQVAGIAGFAVTEETARLLLKSAGNASAQRIVPKLLLRGVPLIGAGLLAYDIYDLVVSSGEPQQFPVEYWDWNPCDNPGGTVVLYDIPDDYFLCAQGTFGYSQGWYEDWSGEAVTPPGSTTFNSVAVVGDWGPGSYNRIQKKHKHNLRKNGVFKRKTNAPVPTPILEPGVGVPLPAAEPGPIEIPFAFPQPGYHPAPFTPPAPGDEPSAKPDTAPEPYEAPAPYTLPPFPWPVIAIPPKVGGRPVIPPMTSIDLDPDMPVAPDHGVNPGTDGPPRGAPPSNNGDKSTRNPRKPDKEYKNYVKTWHGVVWGGINTATEVFDFVVAMHKAVDPAYRLPKKASKAQVLEYMATNLEPWKHIDMETALEEYINMQIGDAYAALGSGAIRNVNQHMGHVTGLDRALRGYEDRFAEQGGERPPIPEIDIDLENGSISFSGPSEIVDVVSDWYNNIGKE